MSSVIDKHIPTKQLSKNDIKHIPKPWITCGIKTSIKIKNKLYHNFLKTKSEYYHHKYKLYRNKINHLIRISKTNYYNNYFSTNKANIKNVWKGIKQIMSLKPMACGLPSKILYDDVELVESKPIADAFN